MLAVLAERIYMNLPNKLTMFRVILIPVFVVFMMCDITPYDKWIALAIFIIASLTDFADGKIARNHNLITDFGKFMDPLADKMLVCSAMICLVSMHILPAWICIVIVAREFIISGFRLIAADKGTVIAAGWWGKFKTTFQMLMVIFMIANIELKNLYVLTQILMWAALILTVISLVDYLVKNKNVIDTTNI
jgi:CDP-diacylglycerol--glycerol-3-phosphate 3-phosphatidyltransferase